MNELIYYEYFFIFIYKIIDIDFEKKDSLFILCNFLWLIF